MEAKTKNSNNSSDEINLIEVIKYLWDGRWLIIKITGIFIVLGLIIALTSTEQFKAEAKLLPEIRDTRGGASDLLRQLGGMGGISLTGGDATDAIRPDLYPEVLKSTPFFLELMTHEIEIHKGSTIEKMDVFAYINDYAGGFSLIGTVTKYTIRLPWTIMGWIRGSDEELYDENLQPLKTTPRMTKKQFETLKILRNNINSNLDQRTWIINVSAEFSDPEAAAQIAEFSVDYLTEYITEYRTEKTKKNLEFIKERLKEKEKEYHIAQNRLAEFRDANRDIVSAIVRAEEERLQHQATLAFNVYNNLSQQYEQARIKIQEETPVIKILEPVQVPIERSKPRRSLIMVISVFLGGFIGVGVVFGKIIWGNIREQLKSG